MRNIERFPNVENGAYRVQVVADSSGEFCGNALQFADAETAEAYARDLMGRWTLVSKWRVIDADSNVVREGGF